MELKINQSEMLSLVLERTGLYIGYGSVERAKAFLDGYTACCGIVDGCYKGFNDWIARRFSVIKIDDWSTILIGIGKSEAESFELLKNLWLEYQVECQKEDEKIRIDGPNI